MTTPDKLVFISYRRSTSKAYARLIFDRLRAGGFDAFLDVNTIDSGTFDSVILSQIGARPHFVVLISPGSLERCQNVGDWLRREIEEAMRLGRNIVPLIEDGVDFHEETAYLPSHLRDEFRRFNAIGLSHEYFDAAIDKLVKRFLKVPTETKPQEVGHETRQTNAASVVMDHEKAQDHYKRGYYKHLIENDYNGALEEFNLAIQHNPDFAQAYGHRGSVRKAKGDLDGAIEDLTSSIELPNPERWIALHNRGIAYESKADIDKAIKDYSSALAENSQFSEAFFSRGNAYLAKGDYIKALSDYNDV